MGSQARPVLAFPASRWEAKRLQLRWWQKLPLRAILIAVVLLALAAIFWHNRAEQAAAQREAYRNTATADLQWQGFKVLEVDVERQLAYIASADGTSPSWTMLIKEGGRLKPTLNCTVDMYMAVTNGTCFYTKQPPTLTP